MINALHAVARAGFAGEPWIPEGPGKWSRPLRFLGPDRGWVELMRLAPGVKVGWHRHCGEVHALNLEGRRRLCTGETAGAGDYVYEADGNVDCWEAVGDEPLVVLVVVLGSVEYLDDDGAVSRRITTADRIADYRCFCGQAGIPPRDLLDLGVAFDPAGPSSGHTPVPDAAPQHAG